MEYRDIDFREEEILLDGNSFTGCTFNHCYLVYRGMDQVSFAVCDFQQNVQWVFQAAAANTMDLLTVLYHLPDTRARQFVEKLLEDIRRVP